MICPESSLLIFGIYITSLKSTYYTIKYYPPQSHIIIFYIILFGLFSTEKNAGILFERQGKTFAGNYGRAGKLLPSSRPAMDKSRRIRRLPGVLGNQLQIGWGSVGQGKRQMLGYFPLTARGIFQRQDLRKISYAEYYA
jgi:hypothetical protein